MERSLVRKAFAPAAHVVIYGALGLSLAAALERVSKRRWFLAGVILVLVAALDEWHQTFVSGRTGRAVDVLVELAGFVVLAFLSRLAMWVKKRLRSSPG
ncbi:VanZ like family protein [Desulfofundulus australicus DSM 11792]|jgi:VanZ family protein|uniref:VanZ like family protein n=1 Tax=Desulfofundulus australicus DSM 11792 TaxID=1121425 RepID=A0A1M5CQI3_9FIRM|nr:VanZ family protein [Desulfofundulus australicus]SHF56968.1 VanZ like family protein [Desulfofundulus australicus DSM 11792]